MGSLPGWRLAPVWPASTRTSWRWRQRARAATSADLRCSTPSTRPDGRLELGAVHQMIAERLPLLPPFRWRLKLVPLGLDYPFWIDDPDFDLEYHVRDIALAPPPTDAKPADRVHVRLLWGGLRRAPGRDISDSKTGEAFVLEVREGERALDVFLRMPTPPGTDLSLVRRSGHAARAFRCRRP